MGFGFKIGSGEGGDFANVVRYDARAGRFFRDDRGPDGKNAVDITNAFAAVADFEQLEVGWMLFTAGAAPDFRMVAFGQDPGAKPTPDHRMGVRVMLKLSKACGGDVRELSASASVTLAGLEECFDAYQAQAAQNPGKLPVIKCVETRPVTSKGRQQSSTNYQPVFAITAWVDRPADLPIKSAAPPAPAPAPRGPAPTGSTQVSAPKAPQPAMADADNDWG